MSKKKSPKMQIQSLLFKRSTGWTRPTATAWAKTKGYKTGASRTELTGDYVRIRQRDPAEFSFLRTVTFGRGIKAVMGRTGASAARKNPKGKVTDVYVDHKTGNMYAYDGGKLYSVNAIAAPGAERYSVPDGFVCKGEIIDYRWPAPWARGDLKSDEQYAINALPKPSRKNPSGGFIDPDALADYWEAHPRASYADAAKALRISIADVKAAVSATHRHREEEAYLKGSVRRNPGAKAKFWVPYILIEAMADYYSGQWDPLYRLRVQIPRSADLEYVPRKMLRGGLLDEVPAYHVALSASDLRAVIDLCRRIGEIDQHREDYRADDLAEELALSADWFLRTYDR